MAKPNKGKSQLQEGFTTVNVTGTEDYTIKSGPYTVPPDSILEVKVLAEPMSVGDIVRLKSGGPKMTIIRLEQGSDENYYVTCTWFTSTANLSSNSVNWSVPITELFPALSLTVLKSDNNR